MKSFLQTEEWAKFQESVGHKVWRFNDSKIRANIIKHDLPFGKSYLYIPHGPEVKLDDIRGGIKNELANFIKYLKYLAKEEKAIFVKVEPLSDIVMELLYRKGFRRSRKQIQPSKTVIINLNLSEEELLSRMHHKTRYNINLSEKKGLVLEESVDVETFWKLLKQTAKKDQFTTHPKKYYEKLSQFFKNDLSDNSGQNKKCQVKLFLVTHEERAIAGAIVMVHCNTAYYLHGASDYEYRTLMAPHFMHWEIIKYLKTINYQLATINYYDLWGINAKKWPGVTRFKLGFGGDLKEYPGSFDLPVSRFWYIAYSIARKVL